MIDIINHSVKVDHISRLQFFYPDYIILSEPVIYSENNIIWIGDNKYLNHIKELGVNYIIVTELADYDLTQRETLLDMAFSKWNRPIPKYVQEFYKDLDTYEFNELIDILWITGKWGLKEHDSTGPFLKLLQSFKTNTLNITKTYLELLHQTNAEYIETSILTFLHRVKFPSGKLSRWYKQVIDSYSLNKKDLIEPAILEYIQSPIDNDELRLFNFIISLNKKRA